MKHYTFDLYFVTTVYGLSRVICVHQAEQVFILGKNFRIGYLGSIFMKRLCISVLTLSQKKLDHTTP